jgi:hypothetical protein
MNINLWNVLMESDFVFDRESYLTLRESCYHLLQQNVPQLLQLEEKEVSDFLSYASSAVNECFNSGIHFDSEAYLCQLESIYNDDAERRKKVYLHYAYDTFEQKMVMLFVACMGIYASKCDDDDDFWEPHGLSGRYLEKDESLMANLVNRCIVPLNDVSLAHFDRRMAVALSGLYSCAVTWMGADGFGFHLHNFFHYIRQKDKQEMMAWVYGDKIEKKPTS